MRMSSRPNGTPLTTQDLVMFILTRRLMLSDELAHDVAKMEVEAGIITLTFINTSPVQQLKFVL